MPFFNWLAVNKDGECITGKTFGASKELVQKELCSKNYNLLSVSEQVKSIKWFKKISLEDKVSFFTQLYQLLDSGILLPKALFILSSNSSSLQDVVSEVYLQVESGQAFYSALQQFPKIFNVAEIQMILAGQEAGDLSSSIKAVADSLEAQLIFKNKLKSLLMLPVVTLIFFVLISVAIFFYIIPSFSSVLTEHGLDNVGFVFKFSLWLTSIGLKSICIYAAIATILAALFLKTKMGRSIKDYFAVSMPFFNKITFYINLTNFLSSLAFMLKAGVNLDKALDISHQSISNIYLSEKFAKLGVLVQEGQSLAKAMAILKIFPVELIAMVGVGQESGNLALMINRSAEIYQQKTNKMLSAFLNAFQPLLMLTLGILVSVLLFSVYIPIFDLANNIQTT